jgi:hypothetical protein
MADKGKVWVKLLFLWSLGIVFHLYEFFGRIASWNYALTNCLELTKEEEAAARTKEAEEQAALPYKWAQAIGDLDITVEVPGNLKGKDLNVDIKKKKLVLGIKGQEPIINVCHSNHLGSKVSVVDDICRATSHTKFTSMSRPGRSLPPPLAPKSSSYIWTR